MVKSELSGKIQTVLGPVAPDDLGITLTHEHLLIDLSTVLIEPQGASEIELSRQPVSLENLSWIIYHSESNIDNMILSDETTIIEEALRYKKYGGRTIVDATSIGIRRDPSGLARIARATDLNVIMGAGYYIHDCHPPDMDGKSEDEIVEEIVKDVTQGVGDTGIKSGIIGEVGCSWPMPNNEVKSLRAASRAQAITGAPLLIHPGVDPSAPKRAIEIVLEAGGDPKRAVMSHLDRTIFDFETLDRLAATGCYLEYDLFGNEKALYPLGPIDLPNDARRLDFVFHLRDQGRLDQVLMAQDVCTKIQLTRYGGPGYSHILEHVVPIMKRRGLSQDEIDHVLIDNPKRALAFT